MTYSINFYKVKECPMCKSKKIEIQEIHYMHKGLDEWKLKCLNCRYELKQDSPF